MTRIEEYQSEMWKERAKEIYKRDNHTCKMCGYNGAQLHCHHLAYPPKGIPIWESFDEELVTLCYDCHKMVHEKKMHLKMEAGVLTDIRSEKCRDCLYCREEDFSESRLKCTCSWGARFNGRISPSMMACSNFSKWEYNHLKKWYNWW